MKTLFLSVFVLFSTASKVWGEKVIEVTKRDRIHNALEELKTLKSKKDIEGPLRKLDELKSNELWGLEMLAKTLQDPSIAHKDKILEKMQAIYREKAVGKVKDNFFAVHLNNEEKVHYQVLAMKFVAKHDPLAINFFESIASSIKNNQLLLVEFIAAVGGLPLGFGLLIKLFEMLKKEKKLTSKSQETMVRQCPKFQEASLGLIQLIMNHSEQIPEEDVNIKKAIIEALREIGTQKALKMRDRFLEKLEKKLDKVKIPSLPFAI